MGVELQASGCIIGPVSCFFFLFLRTGDQENMYLRKMQGLVLEDKPRTTDEELQVIISFTMFLPQLFSRRLHFYPSRHIHFFGVQINGT